MARFHDLCHPVLFQDMKKFRKWQLRQKVLTTKREEKRKQKRATTQEGEDKKVEVDAPDDDFFPTYITSSSEEEGGNLKKKKFSPKLLQVTDHIQNHQEGHFACSGAGHVSKGKHDGPEGNHYNSQEKI